MIWLSMNGYYMRTEDENKTQDLCMEISKTDTQNIRKIWWSKRMKLFEVKSNLIWNKSDLCLLYNSFNKTDTSTFHLCLRLSFETSFLITHILIQCENCGNEIDRCFVTCLFRSLYSSHFCPFILRVTDEVSRTTKYSSFTEIN